MWMGEHRLLKPQPPNEGWKWPGQRWYSYLNCFISGPDHRGWSVVPEQLLTFCNAQVLCSLTTNVTVWVICYRHSWFLALFLPRNISPPSAVAENGCHGSYIPYLTTLWAYKGERRALFCIPWYMVLFNILLLSRGNQLTHGRQLN